MPGMNDITYLQVCYTCLAHLELCVDTDNQQDWWQGQSAPVTQVGMGPGDRQVSGNCHLGGCLPVS